MLFFPQFNGACRGAMLLICFLPLSCHLAFINILESAYRYKRVKSLFLVKDFGNDLIFETRE
jgi:hypothetical protein